MTDKNGIGWVADIPPSTQGSGNRKRDIETNLSSLDFLQNGKTGEGMSSLQLSVDS